MQATSAIAQADVPQVDRVSLESQVKAMYRAVSQNPGGDFHFEMGRPLTENLGYPIGDLDSIPQQAIESFAGVGYYFHLAEIQPGARVLDLGSGSGTDSFIAALKVGEAGTVIGVDMTDEQLAKARKLRAQAGFDQVEFRKGYIEDLPCDSESIDVVISNGVINLSADKCRVFREVARVLKPGGRLALADIVTETQLPETVSCNADLWAACIGGAMQVEDYQNAIAGAGLQVRYIESNPYRFISDNAAKASEKWGVKSISLLAFKMD